MDQRIGSVICGLVLLVATTAIGQDRLPAKIQPEGFSVGGGDQLEVSTRAEHHSPFHRPAETGVQSASYEGETLVLPRAGEPTQVDVPTSQPKMQRGLLTTIFSSLAVVLGTFLVVVWATKKARPAGMLPLPAEVVESLGRAPLMGRQQMQLIRLGSKLILINVTPNGAETLAEVVDPVEVERLAGLCQQNRSGSVTQSFRQILNQFDDAPAHGSFTGAPIQASSFGNSPLAASAATRRGRG